jgi:surface polysaccharide O-acyltransferase-like enzyme
MENTQEKTLKPRNYAIDLLRVLSIVFVLANHLLYPVSSRPDFYNGSAWHISLLIYTISLAAVPIFIMISGHLLIDKKDSIDEIKARILKKIMVPLVFWVVFYIFWKINYRSVSFSFLEIANMVISGNMFFYYFLVILLGLYAMLPVFQLIAEYGSARLHKILAIGSFTLTWFVGMTSYLNPNSTFSNFFTLWIPFVCYFWWGFMSKRYQLKVFSKKSLTIYLLWLFLTLSLGNMGIYLKTFGFIFAERDGIFYWHSYLSPMVSLMSIGLFNWAITSEKVQSLLKQKIIYKNILYLSPLAYGVYLVHPFVIDVVDIRFNYALEFVQTSLLPYVLVRPFLVVFFSFAVAFILSKIPHLKKLIGIDR